jgi:hypothetical protein
MAKIDGKCLLATFDDWDFRRGKAFEREVLHRFGSSVHHPSSLSGSFFLLAVFRRSTFRLTEESVGMALHSILGGSPSGFHSACIKPCNFRFSVASRYVGLLIASLKRITTEIFDVYFHLWRDGGANWKLEFRKWEAEEDASWTVVSRRRKNLIPTKHVHFASPIRQRSPKRKSSPLLSSSSVRIGDFECPVKDSRKHWIKPCLIMDQASIPVKRGFGSLHSQLRGPNSVHGSISISNLHSQPGFASPEGNIPNISASNAIGQGSKGLDLQGASGLFNAESSVTTNKSKEDLSKDSAAGVNFATSRWACFRCLVTGHWVRHCRSPIRCRFCFLPSNALLLCHLL